MESVTRSYTDEEQYERFIIMRFLEYYQILRRYSNIKKETKYWEKVYTELNKGIKNGILQEAIDNDNLHK